MSQVILSIVVLLSGCGISVAADASKESPKAASSQARVKEFVRWLMKDGKDRVLLPGRGASLFDFPVDGVASKAWATGHSNPMRMCSLVLEKSDEGKEPKATCFVLEQQIVFPENHSSKTWHFRYRLDGTLDRAFYHDGAVDENGKAVVGSAVNTPQDAQDPEVQAKAKEELDFWLAKAHELTHKTTAKAETAPAASKSE